MRKEDFKKMTKEELLEGAKKCIDNAIIHRKSANILFKEKIYGISNSHIILSGEESIKAFILMLYYLEVEIPSQLTDIESLFKKHRIKHSIAREHFYFFYSYNLALNAARTIEKNNVEITGFENMNEGEILMSIWQDLLKSEPPPQIKEYMDWWKKADEFKNNGFYVCYINGKWISPADLFNEKVLKSTSEVIDLIIRYTNNLVSKYYNSENKS